MSHTPLALLALALLVERPMHAYEMFQLMTQRRHDRLVKLRAGSLYHTVDRLVRDELAVAVGVDREGNRPERTTYEITATGRRVLDESLVDLLSTPAEEYPQLVMALSEAHNLPADRVAELLRSRLVTLHARRADLDVNAEKLVERRLPRPLWIELDYQRTLLAAETGFLEQLVEQLESGEIDWHADVPDLTTNTQGDLA